MKRAALYMRVSTLDQHPGVPSSTDLRQMAQQRGYEIVEEAYTDTISGGWCSVSASRSAGSAVEQLLAAAVVAKRRSRRICATNLPHRNTGSGPLAQTDASAP